MNREGGAGRLGLAALAAVLLVAGCGATGPTERASRSVVPTPTPTASPTPTPTPALLSKADAEAAARAASEQYADGSLLDARFARYAEFRNEKAPTKAPVPGRDGPIWLTNLGYDPGPLIGQGEFFIIDATDGHVVQHYGWVS